MSTLAPTHPSTVAWPVMDTMTWERSGRLLRLRAGSAGTPPAAAAWRTVAAHESGRVRQLLREFICDHREVRRLQDLLNGLNHRPVHVLGPDQLVELTADLVCSGRLSLLEGLR